mgnify:CR=1 FL=1
MTTNTIESAKTAAKHWYLLLILGVIFILMGILVLRTPVGAFITLSVFLAATFLISGLFEIIYAISNRKNTDNWGWNLASGIIDLLVGILLVSNPGASMVFLIFYVGFALIFRSIMTIGWSINLSKLGIRNWGWILVTGILGLLFSFMLLWNPALTGFAIVIYLAVAFIMIGIAQIIFSFKLKQWKSVN